MMSGSSYIIPYKGLSNSGITIAAMRYKIKCKTNYHLTNLREDLRMKKKLLSVLLVVAMVSTMFVGCGNKDKDDDSTKTPTKAAGTTDPTDKPSDDTDTPVASDEGKVLNIHCWNTEFHDRVAAYFPGYVENADGTGTIGDVTVNWVVTPSQDNAIRMHLMQH